MIYILASGAKNCKFVVKRDLQVFYSKSVSFSTSIQCAGNQSRFPEIWQKQVTVVTHVTLKNYMFTMRPHLRQIDHIGRILWPEPMDYEFYNLGRSLHGNHNYAFSFSRIYTLSQRRRFSMIYSTDQIKPNRKQLQPNSGSALCVHS